MVREIEGAGPDRIHLRKTPRAEPTAFSPLEGRTAEESEALVGAELRGLIERVKSAEVYRKERVHQVLERLQRGELVTSETVREAANRILMEGI